MFAEAEPAPAFPRDHGPICGRPFHGAACPITCAGINLRHKNQSEAPEEGQRHGGRVGRRDTKPACETLPAPCACAHSGHNAGEDQGSRNERLTDDCLTRAAFDPGWTDGPDLRCSEPGTLGLPRAGSSTRERKLLLLVLQQLQWVATYFHKIFAAISGHRHFRGECLFIFKRLAGREE